MNEVKTITADHIRDLKRNGHTLEAMKILETFHNIGKKNIIEGKRINNKIETKVYNKKKYNRLKKEGRCVKCSGVNNNLPHVMCVKCFNTKYPKNLKSLK